MSTRHDIAFYAGIALIAYAMYGPFWAGIALVLVAFLNAFIEEART